MSEITFKVNEFRTYEVVREGVSFGFINTHNGGYNPSKGEELQYDGNTVILKDGREFTDAPQLRSAIREGWISQVGTEVTTYLPKAAGIQVRATEHRGTDRPVKTIIQTERADESAVVSVEDRRRRREATNAEATRKVPLQTPEAQAAMALQWVSGDEEIDDLANLLDSEMWRYEQGLDLNLEEVNPDEELKAQAEADIIAMLNAVEHDTPRRTIPPAAPRSRAIRPPSSQMRMGAPAELRMPMSVENHDARPSMPILREDMMENTGSVVGSVGDQRRTVVEREKEFALDVAQAKPENKSPAPRPRFGGVGAIVHDEQRDMGTISLSGSSPAIKLDESAVVTSSGNETIRMGEAAQVGPRSKTAHRAPETDQGVAVGRILSPAKQSFVADARNTSTAAIQRTAEGGRPKIEKYDLGEDQVDVSEAKTAKIVATGDVQEARSGDTLAELLPDAAKPEVYKRSEEDPRYAAVRMLLPDFQWDKERPVKERVAEALKRVREPMYVKGILAVETELAREEIKQGLAKLFEERKKAKKD